MAESFNGVSGKYRFETLDGLRGLACVLVVLAHFCGATGVLQRFPGLFNAVLAVDTFFVLSGFVLAHSFLSREQRGLPLAPVGLLVQRWVRLWVPFAAATIIGIGLRYGLGTYECTSQGVLLVEYCERWNVVDSVGSLARQLIVFYSPNINAPSWTLPVELLNSLLVPAVMLLLARNPMYVLVLALLSLLALGLPIKIPDALYLFSAGCAMRHGLLSNRCRAWSLPVLGISYLIFLPSAGIGQHVQQALLTPAAIALVLLAQTNGGIETLLQNRFSQLMGRLSFPIYLLHWPLLLGLLPKIHHVIAKYTLEGRVTPWLTGSAYLLATTVIALPFSLVVDDRAIEWGRQLRRKIPL